jgi:hypothetical protein
VRLLGDLVLAAFFEGKKAKDREWKRVGYAGAVVSGEAERHRGWIEQWRRERSLAPFYWEIEFPEVFDRENPGFDAVVGNPPFLGGTLIGGHLGLAYHDYLVVNYSPATGLADLIAFFLRRTFNLIRRKGTLGMIATNTVAQGDTRSTGLEHVLRQGGSLYQAQRRHQWPGNAAVVVSLLQIQKTDKAVRPLLDGVQVDRISSYLLAGYTDAMPVALSENKGTCYRGTKIWGSGFVFEDTPSNGSSSLAEMEHLLSQDPRNRDVISAYLGGEDFNSSPTQHPSRFVIDFENMSEDQARRWPALFSILEERVRPVRANNKQRNYRENWWLHANRVDEAGPYLRQHGRLLALTCVTKYLALAFVQRGTTIQDRMILLLLHEDADFAVLQSRVHEVWVRTVGATLGETLSYTTTCFDTFPRPPSISRAQLQEAGELYYSFRAHLMERNHEGFTKTYNRFHDPDERQPEVFKLRQLHAAMDRAVLDAYGWGDIPVDCEFLLDYEVEELESVGKKKPYRYFWPDDVRDKVLARLLELNRQRFEDERLAADAGEGAKPKRRVAKKSAKIELPTPTLFSAEDTPK